MVAYLSFILFALEDGRHLGAGGRCRGLLRPPGALARNVASRGPDTRASRSVPTMSCLRSRSAVVHVCV